jgi:hypothetical protein
MYIITAITTNDTFKVDYLKVVSRAQYISNNKIEFITKILGLLSKS